MRIYKVELKNYCLKAVCPHRPYILMGSTTCISCPLYEGMIHTCGTHKDFVLDELFTESNIPQRESAFVYLKCSHR